MSLARTSRQQTNAAGFPDSAKAWRMWLVISAIALFFPGQALAHAQLAASQPANKSRAASPKEITLTFNGKAEPIFIRLKDESGHELPILSKPVIERTTIKWAVQGELKPGRYSIEYRAVTADTHPISGKLVFEVE
ncbi:MAG: copper resistance protein CopC [Rhodospirillaceae bacterium]|nr:copper resistance protein CopC [Rhodospirillaceae bacterium]